MEKKGGKREGEDDDDGLMNSHYIISAKHTVQYYSFNERRIESNCTREPFINCCI